MAKPDTLPPQEQEAEAPRESQTQAVDAEKAERMKELRRQLRDGALSAEQMDAYLKEEKLAS